MRINSSIWRYHHQAFAVTVKSFRFCLYRIFLCNLFNPVFVVGNPVMQYLPWRYAECKKQQQECRTRSSYGRMYVQKVICYLVAKIGFNKCRTYPLTNSFGLFLQYNRKKGALSRLAFAKNTSIQFTKHFLLIDT